MSYEQVEEAWTLSNAARELRDKAKQEMAPDDYWDAIFASSELVDVERTKKEGGNPLAQVFLKSPYGLRWRTEYNDWIPFRHGEVKPDNI